MQLLNYLRDPGKISHSYDVLKRAALMLSGKGLSVSRQDETPVVLSLPCYGHTQQPLHTLAQVLIDVNGDPATCTAISASAVTLLTTQAQGAVRDASFPRLFKHTIPLLTALELDDDIFFSPSCGHTVTCVYVCRQYRLFQNRAHPLHKF